MDYLQAYHQRLVESRVKFSQSIHQLLRLTTPDHLRFFLAYHSELGAQLIDSELPSAAKNPLWKTLSDMQRDVRAHKKQDAQTLTAWLNQKYQLTLEPSHFSKANACTAISEFHSLRQQYAQEQGLYGELTLQYELNRLRTIHGFTLIHLCTLHYGSQVLRRLSYFRYFMREQLRVNQLLEAELNHFLHKNPLKLAELVAIANQTLNTYRDFLSGCFRLAEQSQRQYLFNHQEQ